MLATKDDIIRDEILGEAQKLFQQFGLKKTTMEDIARSMGRGKSTLYYYFCSKEEIFDAVVLREMDEVFHLVKHAVEKETTAEDKLKAFALTRIRAVQKRANLYKIVKGEASEPLRCMKHLHYAYDSQETQLVRDILEFGVHNGEFSRLIEKELDILPAVMVSSMRGLERDMVTDSRYMKLETRMDSIIGIMMKGLQHEGRKEKAKHHTH